MSIRYDIIVHWEESPRIIEVLAPSTLLMIQDLVDTLRFLEADPLNWSYPHLVDSYGKQYLAEGKYVGITLALRNARLKFESRPGPGWVRCKVTGGNLVAYDENENPMEPIEVSNFTQLTVELDVSPALIVTGGSALTQEEHDELMKVSSVKGKTDQLAFTETNRVDSTAMNLDEEAIADKVKEEIQPDLDRLLEMYRLLGLDPSIPLIVSLTQRKAGTIVQRIEEEEATKTVTVTRE